MPLPDFVEATLTAQNTFSDVFTVRKDDRVGISVRGVADSTVTVQRRTGTQTAWGDVSDGSYTANAEETYVADAPCELRIGIKTGDYGSDTVVVRLGRE